MYIYIYMHCSVTLCKLTRELRPISIRIPSRPRKQVAPAPTNTIMLTPCNVLDKKVTQNLMN